MEKIHKIFNQFDIFAASPTLRAKRQPKSTNLFSGVVSFLLTTLFVYVFVINAIGLITYSTINSVQTQSRISGTKVKADSIYFAVRVGYLLQQETMKYLQIGYYLISKDGSNTSHLLQPCREEEWRKIGQNYKQQYDLFDIGQYFCPDSHSDLSLQKVLVAPQSQYMIIYVRPCIGYSYCQNQTIHEQFMQNLTSIDGAIFFQVYFLDQAVNPSSRQPISYFINSQCQFGFTTKRGAYPIIQFARYHVQTDMSILPFQDIRTVEGNFVDLYSQTSFQIKSFNDNYVLLYITLNRKFIYVKRKVGKLDEMLSYAGGLFSILVGFLAFFMNSFNEYRYQLMVAEGIFPQDQNGNKIKQKDFTFIKYIKYTIYDWLNILCCFNLKWEECQLIDRTRDEANSHMDATRLFRKLQIIENMLLGIIGKQEKDCLTLIKPQSLSAIKRNRLIIDYYDAVTQGREVLTIQQYKFQTKIYKFGLSIIKQHQIQSRDHQKVANLDMPQQYFEEKIDLYKLKPQQILQVGLKLFKQIEQQAKSIKLNEELLEIQNDLSQQFFGLSSEFRHKIQQKIPIIILIRLMNRKKFRQSMPQLQATVIQSHQKSQQNILIKQTHDIVKFESKEFLKEEDQQKQRNIKQLPPLKSKR